MNKQAIRNIGIFTFIVVIMLSFTTDDRAATTTDGSSEKIKWSAVCNEYVETNSVKRPTALQAIWHCDDGGLLYFDENDVVIEYDPSH